MNHGGSGDDPGQGDGTLVTYGIAVRIAFFPDRWEVLRGFRTTDPEWARAAPIGSGAPSLGRSGSGLPSSIRSACTTAAERGASPSG
jgi:hypothetical protein